MEEPVLDTIRHIRNVQYFLNLMVRELLERSRTHDQSKLESPEKEIFDKYTPLLRDSIYGGEEYYQILKEMKPALDHHYKTNRHHPDYFENGIRDMTLMDLMELLADWISATRRHKTGNIEKSLEINQKRFKYTDELKEIFLNTIKRIECIEGNV